METDQVWPVLLRKVKLGNCDADNFDTVSADVDDVQTAASIGVPAGAEATPSSTVLAHQKNGEDIVAVIRTLHKQQLRQQEQRGNDFGSVNLMMLLCAVFSMLLLV